MAARCSVLGARYWVLGAVVLVLLRAPAFAADAKVEKLTLGSGRDAHAYYLYVPEKAAPGPAPLLLLLHGSGRNGMSLVDPWLPLAKAEGIVLVAPDASDPQAWRMPQEGPDFFHDLIETVLAAHSNIDRRRLYVFGHSAGAIQGLDLGVLEPDYFAAVAVHAGVVSPEMVQLLDRPARKIPLAIWIGTRDQFFPLDAVRRTRDVLMQHGFTVQFTEIPNHTHDYYSTSTQTNREVWAFLKQQKLAADPQFQPYK
jgi:poly(3-hydroxybutyrate) depolymerase